MNAEIVTLKPAPTTSADYEARRIALVSSQEELDALFVKHGLTAMEARDLCLALQRRDRDKARFMAALQGALHKGCAA